jgi:mannose-1-phosphate guanylyltransferase
MEHAADVRMVAAPFRWNDLGGWLALEEFFDPDERGNRGRGSLALLDADGNMVMTEDPEELIALVGVSNLIVVRAGRRTLIVDRSRAEEVKELVGLLEQEGRGEHL